MKDIKLFFSSIFIIIAFFLGYFLWNNQENFLKIKNNNCNISIKILKTKIKISKDKNVNLMINWQEITNNEFILN